jgi:hypothetical protein
MGQHCRVGIEDNLWNSKRERMTTLPQIKAVVELSERFGRKIGQKSVQLRCPIRIPWPTAWCRRP